MAYMKYAMTKITHIDKYELGEEIGRGGFATVYRAQDTRMRREVALKVINGNFIQEEGLARRFEQEAQVAAALHHPRIVTIYDFGESDGMLYLAMRFIRGRTLRQYLEENKPLTLNQALPILAQLAEALDYLKARQLVHRDLKPANVMLEGEDKALSVTLTDFGLVRSLEASTALTRTKGGILGTPAYLAPEQADSKRWGEVTPLTDVYALGVIAYEMLVGQLPFNGDATSLLYAHAHELPPLPGEETAELDAKLVEVLMRALVKRPADRYPSAGTLVTALQTVVQARRKQQEEQSALAQLLTQIEEAHRTSDWLRVQNLGVQIMQIDRTNSTVLSMMTDAMKGLQRENAAEQARRHRAQRYEEGEQALANGLWAAAVGAFTEVAESNPDFRDVQARLIQARDELRRAQLYDEAIAHSEAGHWVEACQAWLNVVHGRLDYRQGEAATRLLDAIAPLLSRYQKLEELFQKQHQQLGQTREELKKYKQALNCYEGMVTAIANEEWQQAVEAGERLVKLMPALKYPPVLVAHASQRMGAYIRRDDNCILWRRDGKEMVRIPAGEYLMSGERTKKNVAEFWLDRTLVTNAEYKRFLDANPAYPVPYAESELAAAYNWDPERRTYPPERANYPVVLVSWQDAMAYAEWAGKRIPLEVEWEKAARGTDGREYPWGNDLPTPLLCNFNGYNNGPTPVGRYSPQGDSPYGCADMSGNVWEWTVSEASHLGRALRGGSWNYPQQYVRVTARYNSTLHYSPAIRHENVGIRCAVTLPDTHSAPTVERD